VRKKNKHKNNYFNAQTILAKLGGKILEEEEKRECRISS